SDSHDVTITYRGNRRLVESYLATRLEEVATGTDVLRSGGVYLITGGLGAVGMVLGEMLSSRYRAKLVLTARRTFPGKEQWAEWLAEHGDEDKVSVKIRQLQVMEEKGAELMVVSADVADEASMKNVF